MQHLGQRSACRRIYKGTRRPIIDTEQDGEEQGKSAESFIYVLRRSQWLHIRLRSSTVECIRVTNIIGKRVQSCRLLPTKQAHFTTCLRASDVRLIEQVGRPSIQPDVLSWRVYLPEVKMTRKSSEPPENLERVMTQNQRFSTF